MPEVTCAQRTPEWFAARRGRITASVAAACLGLDPHRSRQEAWREITGNLTDAEKRREEDSRNYAIRHGAAFEPVAKAQYEAETGNLATECGLWVHPKLDWLAGSPDGVVGPDIVLETKCPENAYWFPPLQWHRRVPLTARIQCLVNLAVTGRRVAHLYVWPKPPQTPQLWVINRAGIPGLLVRLKAWHEEFVVGNVCPPRKTAKRRKRCSPTD